MLALYHCLLTHDVNSRLSDSASSIHQYFSGSCAGAATVFGEGVEMGVIHGSVVTQDVFTVIGEGVGAVSNSIDFVASSRGARVGFVIT